jgi:hypothetical protein
MKKKGVEFEKEIVLVLRVGGTDKGKMWLK